ncbi:MAG TPA: DNA starvation/stationary phase protection protein Dps [Gemmatimonadales bacterium]|nr:DNA starvation/stationary phase protection protein Dps [Gemmatimonadales bacterium]
MTRTITRPGVPVSREVSETRFDVPSLYPTRNDLPESTRAQVVGLLNQRLADAIDLQTQCKQAHWNVKGPAFIALHKLFDEISDSVAGYVDSIAERAVQLGGIAEGTVGIVAARTTLNGYPLKLSAGGDHVAALSDALAGFGRTVRIGIEEMNELEDAGTADILTEISRGIDQWLWFVEAHQQDHARS